MEKAKRKALAYLSIAQSYFLKKKGNALSVSKRDYLGNRGEIKENSLLWKALQHCSNIFHWMLSSISWVTGVSWLSCIDLNLCFKVLKWKDCGGLQYDCVCTLLLHQNCLLFAFQYSLYVSVVLSLVLYASNLCVGYVVICSRALQ